MKSNNLFEQKFLKVLEENIVSGGPNSAFGTGTIASIGSFGNQFPSQNDNAYSPNDTRIPKILGAKKKKKKLKIPIQRRSLPGLTLYSGK
jgi:hypothetical protein